MKTQKFEIDDFVVVTCTTVFYVGKIGRVCNVDGWEHGVYGVEFEEEIGLHTCNGHCKDNHGVNFDECDIRLFYRDEEIKYDDEALENFYGE